jgi:DNA-binding GntR family transcriptional regulator
MVDGLAARLVARRARPEHHDELERILEQQRAAFDPWRPSEYTVGNVLFHRRLIELSENEYVIGQLPLVRMTSQVFTPLKLIDEQRAASAVVEHGQIVAAIAAGDTEESDRLARAHIRATIESLERRLRDGESVA